jgi:hypothetical protein
VTDRDRVRERSYSPSKHQFNGLDYTFFSNKQLQFEASYLLQGRQFPCQTRCQSRSAKDAKNKQQ